MLKWSLEAKELRKGAGNPMYQKDAWNKGLTKDTNATLAEMGRKRKGIRIPESSKQKMSESAKVRKIHGHTRS